MKNLNIFSLISEYETAKSGGVLNVPNVSFVDEDSSVRYLLKNVLTHNGYEYVDLGLPSGLKWATCNVGAISPEQSGLYFAWGETTGYTSEQVPGIRKFTADEYNRGPAASISTNLTLEQDAAHVNMGGNWRLPTKDEYQELIDNCDGVWTDDYNGTGVAGKVLTSKINGNSVFFPAAGQGYNSNISGRGFNGDYWSASWGSLASSSSSFLAWFLEFNDWDNQLASTVSYCGHLVRGVFK